MKDYIIENALLAFPFILALVGGSIFFYYL